MVIRLSAYDAVTVIFFSYYRLLDSEVPTDPEGYELAYLPEAILKHFSLISLLYFRRYPVFDINYDVAVL